MYKIVYLNLVLPLFRFLSFSAMHVYSKIAFFLSVHIQFLCSIFAFNSKIVLT